MTRPEAEQGRPCRSAHSLPIRLGHTLLLDEEILQRDHCLSIGSGLVRVAIVPPDQQGPEPRTITLGFLQEGDHLPLDLLRSTRLHVQALTPAHLESGCSPVPPAGSSSLHEWTVALLMIRHLGDAEQRLGALLGLLVRRLGRRRSHWYELPLRLTHADLAELSGQNRVTVTRQLSKWREQGLVEQDSGPDRVLRLAPQLVET
jgi:hypothetical protein